MNWMSAIDDIIQKYSGQSGGAAAASADPHADFQKVAQAAPQDAVAGGIAQAFRSEQTPPFAEMISKMFGQADPNQRAGLLNRLLQSVGQGGAANVPGLGALSGLLGGGKVTPEQAQNVSPEQVQQIAAHAQQQNPSVVDEVSGFCAQHPGLMKAVGGLAATVALQHLINRR